MAAFAFTDCEVILNRARFSPVSNEAALNVTGEALDSSAFGSSWRTRIMGSKMAEFTAAGWWDVTQTGNGYSYDSEAWNAIESPPSTQILTYSPTGTAGETAYLTSPQTFSVTRGGQYGSVAELSMQGQTTGRVYRGALSFANQQVTGAANGTGFQLSGGIAATETVAMAVHVHVDNATSCDVILESDDNAGFTTATTRATAAVAGTTYTYLNTVAGAITDDYWRARVANLVGTSFTISVSIGRATT